MSSDRSLSIHNGLAFSLADCPVLEIEAFRREILDGVALGGRLAALFAYPGESGAMRLMAVVARADEGLLRVASADVDRRYPALTPDCPQAHLFEREIFEQWNIRPEGHPWLKPVRKSLLSTDDVDFFHMEGQEVHEVAVGPVHAGIIEPGHFRFQCHGETVHHLEIALGYQHRGVERALRGGPNARSIHYMETLAGDSTMAHAVAYCRALEALSATRVPARAQFLRGIAMELERVANHVGDLGALAGDVGFLPTAAYCGRLRGDVLNMTAVLCGNRFGRGMARPGGVAFDLDDRLADQLRQRLDAAGKDIRGAVELLWATPSVMARFDGVGVVTPSLCAELGLVGVAARACGSMGDVRRDFPYGAYRFAHIPVSTWHTGDVFARAYVRWLEVQRSLLFIEEQLDALPAGEVRQTAGAPAPNRAAVALVEGWRGEVCHTVLTDAAGRFVIYKVVDPSFHNWFGLAQAMRNQEISDFPLCNKSFNLSYCGHDL